MSELILVRHGQASFLSGDYDQLSTLGADQAHRLGAWWACHDLAPTNIVVGPRKRHRQTADALRAGMAEGGGELPEPIYDDRLDEFDWDGLLRYANSTLAQHDGRIAELKAAFEDAPSVEAKRRHIQHYMEAVTLAWAREEFFEEGLETWRGFCSRVITAVLAHTQDAPKSSRIALITSGGVAAAAAGHVLGLAPEKTLGLIWTLRNGALVEFMFSGARFSLSAFNSAPHLPDKSLWTYR